MTIALRYAVRSDVGLLREGNEDSAYAGPHLLAVADGMGGYEAGEVASAAVIASVAPLDRDQLPDTELVEALSAAVTTAKQALRSIVDADPAVGSMGTTLTAMLWSGETAAICHIGDSRAYLLRHGEFYQITRDHTFVQALIDQGRIRPEEAATHPQRSLLLRALDGRTDADPDLSVLTGQDGDRFLLCSDGLPVAVTDEQILDALSEVSEPSDAVLRLIELAIAGGGPDNITCIVADVVDSSQSPHGGTQAPVVAGAAASNPLNDTRPISTPSANDDSGVTRMGTLPAGPIAPATISPDGGKVTSAGIRHGHRSTGGTAAGRAAAARVARPARRRWPLMSSVLALFVLIIAVGLVIGYQDIHSQYYVGTVKGKVAIFRGINQTLLGISLSSVDQTTGIPVSGLPATDKPTIGTSFRNVASAQRLVATLRGHYLTCQGAFAKLLAWKASKPERVIIIVRNRKIPKLVKKPRPPVPAMCLTIPNHPAL